MVNRQGRFAADSKLPSDGPLLLVLAPALLIEPRRGPPREFPDHDLRK